MNNAKKESAHNGLVLQGTTPTAAARIKPSRRVRLITLADQRHYPVWFLRIVSWILKPFAIVAWELDVGCFTEQFLGQRSLKDRCDAIAFSSFYLHRRPVND